MAREWGVEIKFLCITSNSRIGGAENFLLRLIKHLRCEFLGSQFDCIITHERGDLQSQYDTTFDMCSFIHTNEKHRRINELIPNYDIVHAIDNFDLMADVAIANPTIPFIQNIFMDLSSSALQDCSSWKAVMEKGFKAWTAVVAMTSENLRYLQGAKISKAIHNGVDIAFWVPNPGSMNYNKVCWVGRVTTSKGVSILIEIIKRMKNVIFEVVANEPKEDIEFLHKDLKDIAYHKPNVFYKWGLNPTQLREIYQTSGIYLHTSFNDNQPTTLLEAMSCGCIPVCNAIPGVREIMWRSGYLIDGTVESYINQIQHIIDISKNKVEVINPRDVIINNYNFLDTVNQYTDLYKKVLHESLNCHSKL